jgi:putative thioredoxin
MTEYAMDVTEATFQRNVIEASRASPVLVDFWAPWCGPCRVLKPVLEKLAADYGGKFRLAKVNSDENPGLSMQYRVRSIPNVKAFVDGELVDEFMGALPESAVREFVDRLIPTPAEIKRREAVVLLDAGDTENALRLLDAAAALEPRNDAIRVARAQALLAAGRPEDAQAALDGLGPLAEQDPRLAPVIARVRIAAAIPTGIDEAALQGRIAADPGDLDARMTLANLLVSRNRYEPALEQLLEIVRRDRGFGDDAGRKAMLRVFDLLGAGNALVSRYRRELASALH